MTPSSTATSSPSPIGCAPAGYRTYQIGKWHLGNRPTNLPTGKGYDHAFALGQSGADNFEEQAQSAALQDTPPGPRTASRRICPKTFYSSRFIVDKTIEYVDAGRPSGKPFLASVNFLANHIPVQAPDADIAAYKDRYTAGWTALRAGRRAGGHRCEHGARRCRDGDDEHHR